MDVIENTEDDKVKQPEGGLPVQNSVRNTDYTSREITSVSETPSEGYDGNTAELQTSKSSTPEQYHEYGGISPTLQTTTGDSSSTANIADNAESSMSDMTTRQSADNSESCIVIGKFSSSDSSEVVSATMEHKQDMMDQSNPDSLPDLTTEHAEPSIDMTDKHRFKKLSDHADGEKELPTFVIQAAVPQPESSSIGDANMDNTFSAELYKHDKTVDIFKNKHDKQIISMSIPVPEASDHNLNTESAPAVEQHSDNPVFINEKASHMTGIKVQVVDEHIHDIASKDQSESLFSNNSSSADKSFSEPVSKKLKLKYSQDVAQASDTSYTVEVNTSASEDKYSADVADIHVTTPASDSSVGVSVGGVMLYNFTETPRQVTGAWSCFETQDQDNYLRGCKWAPDGTCLLTASNDNCLRLFNLPQELFYDGGENKDIPELVTYKWAPRLRKRTLRQVPVLKMKEADTVYDYCWFPKMSSQDPDTACLAVTSSATPIHLFDAFTGELRCSYRPHNQVDELAPAYSLSFNPEGEKLYCGFNKMIRVFDVNRPGKECESRPTYAKQGQPGIISCITHSPTERGLYAAGSYARGIAVYEEPAGEMVCMFLGQQGGVTQLMFSMDGHRLYSGGRKDHEILCWDMRNPGQILYTMLRRVETNQRMYFDQTSDGRYLVSGSHDGTVSVWDTEKPAVMMQAGTDPLLQPVLVYNAHSDTVNGVSFHPLLPIIASSSGQRHFPTSVASDSDSDQDDKEDVNSIDNSLRLWWVT